MTSIPAERARRLADAFASRFECGDLDAVRASLAPDCRVTWFGIALAGDTVVEHMGAELARLQREFDERRLEYRVASCDQDAASVHFTEYLMKMPALWHRREWRMELRFDVAGQVARVALVESAEARDAYARYRERCGFDAPGVVRRRRPQD